MRLLLDEMISPAIARELRARGYDVEAIKRDRQELMGVADQELVRRMASERRAIVTNDIADFHVIHDQTLAAGDEHSGIVFTHDATLPRKKANNERWVERLAALLEAHPREDTLRNRVVHLP